MTQGLVNGSPGPATRHLCIDMQRVFSHGSWEIPWMRAVLPRISRICARHAPATIFTRFIPPESREDAEGTWRRYYDRWPEMTRARIDPDRLELMPELAGFVPPARIFDKKVFRPGWTAGWTCG